MEISSKSTTSVYRDYWRVELLPAAHGEPELLTIAGRRRTTEAFWPPLMLPVTEIGRILAAVGKATTLAERIADGRSGQAPMFPAQEVMAICRGPYYVIELAETTCGDDRASILFTLLQTRGAIRPVLYLIDDELCEFLTDLEEIARNGAFQSAASLSRERSVGELVINGNGRQA